MGKSPWYQWGNPLFLWPFSIAFCMFTRWYDNLTFMMMIDHFDDD